MKKIIIALIVVTMLLTVAGCGEKKEATAEKKTTDQTAAYSITTDLDYVQEQDKTLAMDIILCTNNMLLDEEFGKSAITLGGDLQDATINSVERTDDSEAVMKIEIPKKGYSLDSLKLNSVVDVAGKYLTDMDGQAIEDDVKDERVLTYSIEERDVAGGNSPVIKDISSATVSSEGLDLVAKYEGCRLSAYKSAAGVWTIGYSHTENVKSGDAITKEQAREYLQGDLVKYTDAVKSLVKSGAIDFSLTQGQLDALTSFAYNMGKGNLKNLVNGKSAEEIADGMLRYNKGGGKVLSSLDKRRKEERKLFLS